MCTMLKYVIGCAVFVCLSVVLGAPVTKQDYDQLKAALKSQLKEQEESALESLDVPKQTGPNGVEFSKSKSFTYSNINGAEQQQEQSEDKVSEAASQRVLSDLKEQFNKQRLSPEQKPVSNFKASLDIPDEGIHKEVTDNGDQESLSEETESESSEEIETEGLTGNDQLSFTPKVVAQYLYSTGETEDFQTLLNELVETSEITSEEAEQYEMAVMNELYKIEQEQQSNINVPSLDSMYPQAYDMQPQQPAFPMYDTVQSQSELYPMYDFGNQNAGPMKLSPEEDSYINYLLNKPVSLDGMINQLLNQWLNKAIETGDPEAEEILTNIVDFVSQDDNPNDEAQVKSILGDIFAEALLEDLAPRIEPQDIRLGADEFPMVAVDAQDDMLRDGQDDVIPEEEVKGDVSSDVQDAAVTSQEESIESDEATKVQEAKM